MGDGQSKGGRGRAPCECVGGGFPASAGLPRGVRSWPCLPPSVLDSRMTLHAAAGRCASFFHSIRPHTRQSLTCMSRRGGVRDWIAVCVRWLRVSCRGCHRSANVPPAELHRRCTMWRLACRHLRWLFIKTARCGRNHRSPMQPSKCMLLLLRAPLPLYHSSYSDTLVLSALCGAVRASGRTVGCPCLSQAHVLHRPLCRW